VNGTFFCSSVVVPFADAKQALYEKTGAYAVEMESLAVRTLAIQHNLPLIHVRGISDSAEDDIHPMLMLLGDEFGRPKMKRVLTVLATRFMLIKDMIALGKNANAAAKAAAECVREIVQAL
jgi:adenosylhomocysteine nucleosidase